ncbi:hypothetical protein AAFB16_002846 [Enterococcus faecalis]
MSFVSAFITKDFASIMSDGQVTGDNRESIQEDYKKIIKVNNFLIGFTGNGVAPVELIKAGIKATSEAIGKEALNIDLLIMLIKECLSKYVEHINAEINIVLIGFNKKTPVIATFTLKQSKIHEERIEFRENLYRLITLCPFDYRLEDGSEGIRFIEKLNGIEESEINLAKITEMQREMNDFVADNSITVNKYVFSEYLRNDRL